MECWLWSKRSKEAPRTNRQTSHFVFRDFREDDFSSFFVNGCDFSELEPVPFEQLPETCISVWLSEYFLV